MSDTADSNSNPSSHAIGGGTGSVPAFKRPGILLSGSAGIVATTPCFHVASAGQHISFTAQQDVNLLSQRQLSFAVNYGVVIYTAGEKPEAGRPVDQTGIQLHAASGNVVVQANDGKASLTAQKQIEISSTTADVRLTAPEHILLTAGGSYIKMENGNIEIGTSGNADFWARLKVWSEGETATPDSPVLPKAGRLENALELNLAYDDLAAIPNAPYKVIFNDGGTVQGQLDADGYARLVNVPPGDYVVEFGEDPNAWVAPPLEQPAYKKSSVQAEAKALIEQERAAREAFGGETP